MRRLQPSTLQHQTSNALFVWIGDMNVLQMAGARIVLLFCLLRSYDADSGLLWTSDRTVTEGI